MSNSLRPEYDAILIVSFGGPERREDVLPFLENVVRGKSVPRQRLLEVADHYYHFGGVSPINTQNRALVAALEAELAEHGPHLPVFWGNRNWDPLLPDTLQQMAGAGIRRALAFFTSAYSSYSGCRQYRENVAAAQRAVGSAAPQVDKLRVFFNHPGFIEPVVERARAALTRVPADRRDRLHVAFTAHSIPQAMAGGCDYERQLMEASRLVVERLGTPHFRLVYQSRSGPPTQTWLGPDINDHLVELAAAGVKDVLTVPIGFTSDHLEVLYDLDVEARATCERLGIGFVRAETVGTHPRFIRMIRELILERTAGAAPQALGNLGPWHDVCPEDCCPAPVRPALPPKPTG